MSPEDLIPNHYATSAYKMLEKCQADRRRLQDEIDAIWNSIPEAYRIRVMEPGGHPSASLAVSVAKMARTLESVDLGKDPSAFPQAKCTCSRCTGLSDPYAENTECEKTEDPRDGPITGDDSWVDDPDMRDRS